MPDAVAEAQEQLKNLLKTTDDVLTKVAQRKVLSVLAFPEMRSRRDLVAETHAQTFSWIFYDQELKPYDESWDWEKERSGKRR
ncbi:hypothetical protein QBC38DRAFT_460577 [Podospora fimiseda]|uniref:Uncharacterized protein n=1 Tax=Podospora fimiseda TaxID=252190 RepID=A0AAN7BE07_9PEZI|nr:hypothetical protein QBC38DRAFT_460577 [Podospora fimiseda]